MWYLRKISAKNIAAFREFEYELKQGVTTLIFGSNEDNDSQGSNGSGKSALIEAIAIAITGEPLRKVTIGEIINDAADDAMVRAEFCNRFTKEVFTVTRIIDRKNPQSIDCEFTDNDGKQIRKSECVQSGVADYNKYVLETLGIAKQDVYNVFVLSKHRFKCFLSLPDKEKKETINKFFNADLVDKAMEIAKKDRDKAEAKWQEAEKEHIRLTGSLQAVNDNIEQFRNDNGEERTQSLIESSEKAIAEKREANRSAARRLRERKEELEEISGLYDKLNFLEGTKKDLSLDELYDEVAKAIKEYGILANWSEVAKETEAGIEQLNKDILQCDEKRKELEHQAEALGKAIVEDGDNGIDETIAELADQSQELFWQISEAEQRISKLKVAIDGAVECPKCKHKFTVGGEGSLDELKDKVKQISQTVIKKQEEKARTEKELREMQDKQTRITDQKRHLSGLKKDLKTVFDEMDSLTRRSEDLVNYLGRLKTRMFDEAFGNIEKAEADVKQSLTRIESEIDANNKSIEATEQYIKQLKENSEFMSAIKVLEAKKESLEKELIEAKSNMDKKKEALSRLEEQMRVFAEFKTHLANTKINALANATNDFLEKIGSDIRIRLDGFTMLKSGKIRDKISVSLLRNGTDCGSFDKFSEGEKARVNLANILALHELTNASCDDGKGLDLLVLDEILEATDESGLSSIFRTLNELKQTSLVVSHGMVAENYPHRLVVAKRNGTSQIP